MNASIPHGRPRREDVLASLAKMTARRLLHAKIKPIDTRFVEDRSGAVHWMYNFTGFEKRIYRVQNGTQRFVDIKVDDSESIDVENVAAQIEQAMLYLNVQSY